MTPSPQPAAQDHLEVVQCLVESGLADPEKTNDCGWTPLHEGTGLVFAYASAHVYITHV